MPISPPFFADRIINIAVTGPLIRIELGVAEFPDGSGQNPPIIPSQTLIMSIDGFANSFGVLDQVMKKLIQSGMVKARSEADTPQAT